LLFLIYLLDLASATNFCIGVVIFFIGFNMHEPIMQSLASKFAKVHQRGLVLGIFNSAGYLGTFVGGVFGGMFYNEENLSTMVIVIALICALWAVLILTMANPAKKKFAYLSLNEFHLENSGNLTNDAIDEWYINNTENVIAIKYDNEKISEEEIKALLR
jgi:MFS family permease